MLPRKLNSLSIIGGFWPRSIQQNLETNLTLVEVQLTEANNFPNLHFRSEIAPLGPVKTMKMKIQVEEN